MNEYSEKDYRELNELSDKWQTEYESSIHFTELPDNQRVPAFFIISNFTDMMYNYHVQKPNEWEPDALEDVICDLFPRKISSDDDLYIAVEPVLTSYFEYLITKKHIKNTSNIEAIIYKCDTCNDYETKSKYNYNRHIKSCKGKRIKKSKEKII